MKKLLLLLLSILYCGIVSSQLPYTWTAGVNPGWVSANAGAGGPLQWQPVCGVVTINCATFGTPPLTPGGYSSNALSTYTSPVINATCTNASSVSITFRASGNMEFTFDFLFVEYSLNGGATWINPYGAGVGWTGNFGFPPGSTIPPIIAPTSPNFRFRFTFDSDFSVNYNGVALLDFDIVCNVVLPVELIDFRGEEINRKNEITWITASEVNNNYFTVERSTDLIHWEEVCEVIGAGNSNVENTYKIYDDKFKKGTNYYRLSQTDFDGTTKLYNPISIQNNSEYKTIIRIYDLQGKEYGVNLPIGHPGLYVVLYSDDTFEKVIIN